MIIWLNRLYWFLIPPVTWTFYLLFFYRERAQVVKTCYMPKVIASIFWSDCFETKRVSLDRTNRWRCHYCMQKCDKIFDFAATKWSKNAWTVISRHFRKVLHTQTPKMRLTLLVKLRKIENYFSSKLKTDGNIVFDPLCDCCDSLRSWCAKVKNSNPNCWKIWISIWHKVNNLLLSSKKVNLVPYCWEEKDRDFIK